MGFHGDDIRFSKFLSNGSIIEFIFERYNTWSQRVVIECVLIFLTKLNIIVWEVLDSFLFTIGAYYIIKIVNRQKNKNIVFLGILLFLMYPFCDMSTAGWMATTLNYLWCFSLGVVSFIPLINKTYNEKTSKLFYLIVIIGLIYSTNHEQSCLLIFGLNLVYLINCIVKKQKINKYNILALIISAIGIMIFINCPGIGLRNIQTITADYPDFMKYNFLIKSYLGIVPTVGILLQNQIIIVLFYIILNITILLKIKNKYLRYVFFFNIIFILSITLFKSMLIDIFPGIKLSLDIFLLQGTPDFHSKSTLITIAISLYILISSFLIIFKVFGKNYLLPTIVFLAGFLSRFLMGFSPTIFISRSRTAIFLYMSLIMIILMLINELYNQNKLDKNKEFYLNLVFITIAIFNYINIFICIY